MEYITSKIPAVPELRDAPRVLTSYLRGHKNELNHALECLHSSLSSRIGALEQSASFAEVSTSGITSGVDGGWYWRRYPDGTAECRGKFTRSGVKCATKWGGLYISEDCEGEAFPFEFDGVPVISMSISGTGARGYLLGYPNGENSATSVGTGKWWFVRGTASDTEDSVSVDICAVGRVLNET